VAHRHHDDDAGDDRALGHSHPGPADVEGGDDRDRDRSHDQGELPCGYALISHVIDLKESAW
jgi:hypothetical protein